MSEKNNKEKGNAFDLPWQKKGGSGTDSGAGRQKAGSDYSDGGYSIYAGEAGFSKDAPQELLLERIKRAAAALFGGSGEELTMLADELERRASGAGGMQYGAMQGSPMNTLYGQGASVNMPYVQGLHMNMPYEQRMQGTPVNMPYGQRMQGSSMNMGYGQGMQSQPMNMGYGQGMQSQSMNMGYGQGMQSQPMNMGYGQMPGAQTGGYNQRSAGESLASKWQNEARQLKLIAPDFDLKQALSDKTFTDALSMGKSVIEAYAESMRMPKNSQRGSVYQNGQSARRGTGEASLNPADMSPEDFKRYIEKLKEQ